MQSNGKRGINRQRHGVNATVLLVVIASQLSACSLLQSVGILAAPEASPVAQAPTPLSEQAYEVSLRLVSSADLNPDSQSRPSPVQVRVFIMEPQTDIRQQSFEELFDYTGHFMQPRPQSTLTMQPGQTRDIVLAANRAQSLLVVAAAFRDPYQSLWKAIATLTPTARVTAMASIGATTVTINPGP